MNDISPQALKVLEQLTAALTAKPVSFEEAQAERARMVEGRAAAEHNELVDVKIPDVWRDGKDGPWVSIYCTVEVSRAHNANGEKAAHYGNVVNFWRNFRYHDGDDSKYAQLGTDGEIVRDHRGNIVMSNQFHARHVCNGDIEKIAWPMGVDEARRAEFHRSTFFYAAMNALMGMHGHGLPLSPALRVHAPEPAKPAKK